MPLVPAPVVLFVYARADHAARTLAALAANDLASQSDLTIYADAPHRPELAGAVAQVRQLISSVQGFRSVTIHAAERNIGCAASIRGGITAMLAQHERVIVMEDDIVTAPGFLRFVNEGLEVYEHRPDIFAVSGFAYPQSVVPAPAGYRHDVHLTRRPSPWGWGTWRDRWHSVDWTAATYPQFRSNPALMRRYQEGGYDMPVQLHMALAGELDAWDIQFSFAKLNADAFTLVPVHSLVDNIGFDGSGSHAESLARFRNDLAHAPLQWSMPGDIAPDPGYADAYYHGFKPSLERRVRRMVRETVRGALRRVAG